MTTTTTPRLLHFVNTDTAHEHEVHQWVAFASDLQFPVGKVPTSLPTSLGNGQPFVFYRQDQETSYYRQALGCITLTVFND